MNLTETITLSVAVLGAGLGILNTWNSISERKVKLRVIPKQAFGQGWLGVSIEIINLSAFPVTVQEVGFLIGRGRGPFPRRAPILDGMALGSVTMPCRIGSREAVTIVVEISRLDGLSLGKAYALTSSGELIKGDSAAMGDVRNRLAGTT